MRKIKLLMHIFGKYLTLNVVFSFNIYCTRYVYPRSYHVSFLSQHFQLVKC